MSCLSIGFPPLRTVLRITDMADPAISNKCGVTSGWRHHLIYTENPASIFYIDFDYGSNFAADYLYIPKLALTENITGIGIETSTDDLTYTGVYSTTTIEFQGNNDEDFFIAFPLIGPSRFWRVSMSLSPSSIVSLSKIYLGKFFTFEKYISPSSKHRLEQANQNTFITTSGRYHEGRTRKLVNSWDVEIKGLSDSNIEEFLDNVLEIDKRYLLLYDSNQHSYFNNRSVWHGIINPNSIRIDKELYNLNNLSFNFKEMR